jgi:hypothetical protein
MNTSRDPAVPEVPLDLLNPTLQLDIRGVSKTYPNGVQALKDVTLTIPVGLYGLLGPNGADEMRNTLGYLPQELGVYPKGRRRGQPESPVAS